MEQTIILPWILLDRDVHPTLWKAENERHLRNLIRDGPSRSGSGSAALLSARVAPEALANLERWVDEARALALENHVVGVRENGSLLPGLDVMTAQIGTPEAKEAYFIAYNVISGWTHSSAGALGLVVTPDGVRFENGPVEDTAPIRSMAAAAYLYVLEIVSREVGLGIEDEAGSRRKQLLLPA